MIRYQTWFLAILAFILPLALYVKTLAPTYIPIDSAEFALCMHFWGVCHPPGFPLYTVIGKIITDLWPWGTLIYKANLISAFFGALTILVVYLDLSLLKVGKVLAFLLSLFLAVSQIFWEFSLSADVFTFATFLIALTVFLAFKKRVFLAFLVLGLSASHFYISAVLWPILAWYMLGNRSNTSNKSYMTYAAKAAFLLLSAVVFALGFLPQALMYFRMQQSPEINWGHAQGIFGYIDFLRRKEFGSIFLLSNPVLQFHLVKVFKHFWAYSENLFLGFGVILPIITLAALAFLGILKRRKVFFLLLSFICLTVVQLVLLSTIDPLDAGSPFQITKFYLPSYVLAILLIGVSLEKLSKKLFLGRSYEVGLILGFLILIYLFANYHANNYAKNYFSQDMVLDAMGQLPDESLAITVSHVFYFGGQYAQKIDNKFSKITLLYFPNEKNRDSEKYHPEILKNAKNQEFIEKVTKDKDMGSAESYILSIIAANLNRPIYILQGTFEENFFGYLKPYIRPYGLWWRVESDLSSNIDIDSHLTIFDSLKNQDLSVSDLQLKQQKDDLLTYAVAYNSTGVLLASNGRFDEAIKYFNRSLEVNPDAGNVKSEIELVQKTQNAYYNLDQLIDERQEDKIVEVGNNLFTLGNYQGCIEVFSKLTVIAKGRAQAFNNLASCQASSGKVEDARENYGKALAIDPNLDLAKKGLEAIGDD